MPKTLLAAILVVPFLSPLLLVRAAHASPDDYPVVKIASGRKGGTYRSVYARNLEKLMRGYKLVYLPSEGSGQNLDALADRKADVAFAQADVFAERVGSAPERFEQVMVIGRLAPECVYIAHRVEGPVQSLGDLGTRAGTGPTTIVVGDSDSGMAGTWAFMSTLVSGLQQVRIDHTVGTLALNQLAAGSFQAVGWVTDPTNTEHKLLRALLANDRLAVMPLTNPELLTTMADGTQVYEARNVTLEGGLRKKTVDTICTSAMMFARRDADPRLIDKLSDVVSLELDKIVPKAK